MDNATGASVAALLTVGLSKEYAGGTRALDNVSISVRSGEVFGLLGQNGAGKTTLIRILLDMIRPTGGYAEVMGIDTQLRSVDARRHIGYLPSSPRFYSQMTAAEQLGLIAGMRGDDVDEDYMHSLIERLELDADKRIHTLSRGNQQKVGLVLALMFKADVIILDEPTSGLDPLMQETVLAIVREVAADGRTVFFSSHILHEVEALCDRVAVLRGGALAGTFDLAEQRRLAPRQFTVRFTAPVAATALEGIAGAHLVRSDGTRAVFSVTDGVDELVKRISTFPIAEIEAHEPTLEEYFFSLYGAPEHAESAVTS